MSLESQPRIGANVAGRLTRRRFLVATATGGLALAAGSLLSACGALLHALNSEPATSTSPLVAVATRKRRRVRGPEPIG